MATIDDIAEALPTKKPDAGVQAAQEVVHFLGSAYAYLQAMARYETLGAYTMSAAIQDRILQLEGANGDDGRIADLRDFRDKVDEYVAKARGLNPADLKSRGLAEIEKAVGGVSPPIDPSKSMDDLASIDLPSDLPDEFPEGM